MPERGLDRVREAVRKARGDLTGEEVAEHLRRLNDANGVPPVCSWHRPSHLQWPDAWNADADRRPGAGEKQRQCPICERWFWPDQFGEAAGA